MGFKFHKKISKTHLLAALTVVLFFLFSLAVLWTFNRNRTILGLTAAKTQAGWKNSEEFSRTLAGWTDDFNGQKITLAYKEKIWSIAPQDIGIVIDREKTTAKALAFGHGPFLTAMKEQVASLFMGHNIPLEYHLDMPKFNRTLDMLAEIETPVKNSSLKYDVKKNNFAILPAQSGMIVDRDRLVADIIENFNRPAQIIYLSLTEEKPAITEKDMEQVAEQAKILIDNAPYFLQSDNATWQIDKSELAGWISAVPSNNETQKTALKIDREKIINFLIPMSASVNREPRDAKLTSVNGELKFATLSQDGQKLDVESSAKKISEDILANKKNIYLITDPVKPKISNYNTEELGLLTLIGRGESNFSGSPANRRVNIKVGATKLNGFLIKPGEEFSFSQNIGDIDAPNGWVPELVIKNMQTIPEYGGGLCQVSTTLFRAAVNSGLKVTERHPHAYPVHYYDPPGFDATVYPPSPDLKFLNDTPGHILLQTKIEGNKLTFEMYGTADGRQVKIKGPTITQKNSNGSLKATLTQEIWRDGQLERKQVFNSSYNSPALYPNPYATPSPSPSPAGSPASPSPGGGSPAPSPTTSPSLSPSN